MSFTDATCISVMKEQGIVFLASFDGRSFDGIVNERIGEVMWSSLSEEEKKEIKDISIREVKCLLDGRICKIRVYRQIGMILTKKRSQM